ncbi:MFS general substrate transporter [Hesseltinella vesiculosa]|uniref:MFS general substrate transporter n=1 Tax=Hesseltinella vesiculosa TaxID=101127 RepID=A0A1X2GU08_9FUNG|nr:MFS general substrate transporter [Hesseltinella vesiculosa]
MVVDSVNKSENSSEVDDKHLEAGNFRGGGDEPGKAIVYSATEKAVLRKIWLRIMPLACIITFLQWIDKYTLNMSAVLGIKEDANINTTQFNFLGSLFYLGYLVIQIPNTYLLQVVPISKFLGVLLILWGVVLACMSQGHDFSSLGGMRFVLGLLEGGSYPSVFLLVATVFRRHELSTAIGALWIANGFASTFGGLIGYGSATLSGRYGMAGWQWIFLIFGVITVFVGLLTLFLLVDTPFHKFLQLTAEEEEVVKERLRDNAVVPTKEFKWSHIFEALRELRFYALVLSSMFMMITNGFFTIYSSSLVASFGFSGLDSVLLQMPNGFISLLSVIVAMWASRRFNQLIYVAVGALSVSGLGLIVTMAIPSGRVKILGTILIHTYGAGYCMLLSVISANVSGYTKKIWYQGAQLIFYTIGNFVGPFLMTSTSGPRYLGPLGGYLACNICASLLLLTARFLMARDNQRKRSQPGFQQAKRDITSNLTDQEDPNFLYRL